MKKKIVLSLIAVVAATSISAFADINIKVNGADVPFSTSDNYGVPFVDENNRTLVPFRKTLEFAGATVDWIADSKTAVAKKGGIEVKVPIGEKYIYIDGELESIDTQAIIKDGRTYLPIRAVLEALQYDIGWDQASQTVIAQTEEFVTSLEEELLITEAKVVPREEVIEGKIYENGGYFDDLITSVRLLVNPPCQLTKEIINENNDKIINAHVGSRKNGYGALLFIIDKKVVGSNTGYYRESDGTIGYFLEEGYDFDDFDQLGFDTATSEMIVFDNPFK